MKSAEYLKYEINPRKYHKFPLNWNKLFKRDAPLAVEIGCGNGEFLSYWCHEQPDWNFVGIDFALESAERAQACLFRHKIQNGFIVRDDAQFVVRELFYANSLSKVVMNYPDPWPKEKHKNRRLINSDFVRSLSSVLTDNGIYELVTDQEWYAINAETLFAASGFYKLQEIKKISDYRISTKYERKWRVLGRESYLFSASKRKNTRIKKILKDSKMPHRFIENEVRAEWLYGLKDYVKNQNGTVFNIKNVYSDQNNSTFLLKTVCIDGNYKQNVFLIVAKHLRGYIVKLDISSPCYRTPAVKLAVQEIGEILSVK